VIITDSLFQDLRVYAALLDRFGFILSVNSQWKALVDAGGMILPHEDRPASDYGIGENYLRFCAFADPLSPRLITGISQLLAGQIDCMSIIYPRRSATQNTSFMLFGVPYAVDGSRAALLHIDITAVYATLTQNRVRQAGGGAVPDVGGFAEGSGAHDLAMVAATLESSVLSAISGTRELDRPAIGRGMSHDGGDERQPPLSKRQWQVLSLMTNGLTNVEIARQLGLSPNTVKIHVSGILARLGLPSRTQAVHWALTQGRQDKAGYAPDRS
jgi:DNA-binding CsgD family transcriptional regulator